MESRTSPRVEGKGTWKRAPQPARSRKMSTRRSLALLSMPIRQASSAGSASGRRPGGSPPPPPRQIRRQGRSKFSKTTSATAALQPLRRQAPASVDFWYAPDGGEPVPPAKCNTPASLPERGLGHEIVLPGSPRRPGLGSWTGGQVHLEAGEQRLHAVFAAERALRATAGSIPASVGRPLAGRGACPLSSAISARR